MIYRPKYENSYALIIGINKYDNSPLQYAKNDAETIAGILKDTYKYPATNISTLFDEEATKNNILSQFHGYTQDGTGPDDKLLIFFAGHGHTIIGQREVGFLVPVDGKMDDTSSLIRWDEFTRNAELIKAKHILFIMDACYGGLITNRAPAGGSSRFLKDMCQRFSRQVLTAGKADEAVADAGGPVPEHSIFTGYLIQAISGEAEIEKGVITANSVMSYVYNKVAHDTHSRQTPHFGFIDGDGDFIFKADILDDLASETEKDKDYLIQIPITTDYEKLSVETDLIGIVKEYITDSKYKIKLHDII